MADLTQDEITGAVPVVSTGSIFDRSQKTEAQHETLLAQDKATWSEKGKAFYDQAVKDNTLDKIVGSLDAAHRKFAPEPDYFSDDDTSFAVLKNEGLSIKHFEAIRGARSNEELQFRLAQARREDRVDMEIENSLGNGARTFASVTGGLLDIDLVAGLGVGMLTKASSLAKVMTYDGITETSLVATRFMVNEDYTIDDAVFDMTVGLAITSGANRLMHSIKQPKVGKGKNDDAFDAANYKWSAEDFRTVAKEGEDITTTVDMMNTGKTSRAVDDVEIKKQTKGTPEFEAEQVRVKDVRTRIQKSMGVSEAKIKELEARRAKQEADGMSAEQIRKMDADDGIKGIPDTHVKLMNVLEDMTKDMGTIKDDVYKLIRSAPKEDIVQLKEIVDDLVRTAPKEMEAVKRLYNSRLSNKKFDKVLRNIEDLDLKPATKKKLMAATIVLGATGAQAAEDSIADELTGLFVLSAIAFVGGPTLLKKIRNANIRETVSNIGKRVEQTYHKAEVNNSKEASFMRKMGVLIADSAHTRITSTVAPYNKAGGNAEKLMNDLVYSAKSGAGAETTKAMWAHGTMFKYATAENKAYKAWKAENGITLGKNILDDMNAIHKFRNQVTDNMELRNSTSPAIRELTAKNDELMQEMWDRVKEYKVYGFEKIDYKAGMIPRLWKTGELNNIVNRVSDADQLKIRDAIANAIAKTNGDPIGAKELADRYLHSWKKGFSTDMGVSRAEDVFGSVSHLFKEEVDFEKFADAMNITKDRMSRSKYRIEFDVNDIEPVKVNIDGEDVILDKSKFVERDFKTILDRVSNSMYGSAAIAKRGYKSRAQLDKAIEGISDETMRSEMSQVADLVLGNPIPSNNKFLHNISMITKDLTMVAKLPFVVFSMPPELIATLGNAGFVKGIDAVYKSILHSFGKDSAMMGSLSEVSGLGTSTRRLDFSGYRGLTDDITNLDDAGLTSKVRAGTMRLRDFSMLANGLSYFSDVLQRANLQLDAEKFANFIISGEGGAKGINPSRLKSFGIDDKTIKMFKNTFELNDKGRLKDYDISKWSIEKRDRFGEILRDMNQAVSPETTIGETGLYTRTTDLGRMASSLVSYPMQQFNIHGLEDMRHFDRMSFMHSVGGFGGAYLGLQARYGVQDKEVDNDKILMYALLNVPQFGGLSAVTSMADPATLETVQSALNVVGMGRQ